MRIVITFTGYLIVRALTSSEMRQLLDEHHRDFLNILIMCAYLIFQTFTFL